MGGELTFAAPWSNGGDAQDAVLYFAVSGGLLGAKAEGHAIGVHVCVRRWSYVLDCQREDPER